MIRLTILSVIAGAALLVPSTWGQAASSANFQLETYSFNAVAGGGANAVSTEYQEFGALRFEQATSTNFQAEIGFLALFDPDPGDMPVVWATRPVHADKAGGVPITIYGRNLNLGAGPVIQLGGAPVTSLSFTSGTRASGITPVGTAGPADIFVSHSLGSIAHPDDWVFSPAVVTPEFAYQDSFWTWDMYGNLGHFFQTWASPQAIPLPGAGTAFGKLLIGPDILINLLPTLSYTQGGNPNGVVNLGITLPVDPILVGITIYLQTLNQDFSNPPSQLTNRSQTTFR